VAEGGGLLNHFWPFATTP